MTAQEQLKADVAAAVQKALAAGVDRPTIITVTGTSMTETIQA